MGTLSIVGLSLAGLAGLLALLAVLRGVTRRLRARGEASIAKRYPSTEVLLQDPFALSFGQQSRGATQARGNGALALTAGELWFELFVPTRAVSIPLGSIVATSLVRSHLGKTQGVKLLHVRFTIDGAEDAIAWRLADPAAWKARIDGLRAAT